MRLLLLPLGRGRSLIHCQQLLSPRVRSHPRIDEKAVTWVTKQWTSFQSSDTRWKQVISTYAHKLLDTVPFEENGLRTIPPQNTWKRRLERSGDHVSPEEVKAAELEPIDLTFPFESPTFPTEKEALKKISDIALNGVSFHQRRMIICMVSLPLTLPFALIPVIPNLPGFYVSYRLYCHWKAWQGAKHLRWLVEGDHIQCKPLPALDVAYKEFGEDLSEPLIKRLDCIFEAPQLHAELEHAHRQIEAAAAKEAATKTKAKAKLKTQPK